MVATLRTNGRTAEMVMELAKTETDLVPIATVPLT
jgi:hypothetical protein